MTLEELVTEISIVIDDRRMHNARKLSAIRGVLRKHHTDMLREQAKLRESFSNPTKTMLLPPAQPENFNVKATSRWDDETELRILAMQQAVQINAHNPIDAARTFYEYMNGQREDQCDHWYVPFGELEQQACVLTKGHEGIDLPGHAQFHITINGLVFNRPDESEDDTCDYSDGVEDCVLIYGHQEGLEGVDVLQGHINKYGKVFKA